MTDEQLMQRVQAGDSHAFGVLYDRFAPRAHGLARAMVPRGAAEDVVQEAFLSVWRSRAAFRPDRGTVMAWVMATVRNRALDAVRRHGRHDHRWALCEDDAAERLPAPVDVEAQASQRDEAARLRATLTRLPAAQREVIALAYFGELSASEIARELSLPIGTVKGRMRLGLTKLRVNEGAGCGARVSDQTSDQSWWHRGHRDGAAHRL